MLTRFQGLQEFYIFSGIRPLWKNDATTVSFIISFDIVKARQSILIELIV